MSQSRTGSIAGIGGRQVDASKTDGSYSMGFEEISSASVSLPTKQRKGEDKARKLTDSKGKRKSQDLYQPIKEAMHENS